MEIRMFKNFIKRDDSTKQPSGTYAPFDVYWKQETSILEPTLILESALDIEYNYIYIPSWDRFYYIDDVKIRNANLVEIQCKCDYLATNKSAIGNYTAYIERSASGYDLDIDDVLIPQKQGFADIDHVATSFDWYDNSTGTYIVQMNNKDSSGFGVSVYAMNRGQVGTLLENILNTDMVSSTVDDLITALFDPMKYIISIKWLPIDIDSIAGTMKQVKLGIWDKVTCNAKLISSIGDVHSRGLNIPDRFYNDFRDYSDRYSKYKINLPGVGLCDISAMDMRSSIGCEYVIDYYTCECKVRLYHNNQTGNYFATYNCNLGASVQLSQVTTAVNNVLSNALVTTGAVASGNYVAGATGAIETFIASMNPTPSVIGRSDNRTLLMNENAVDIIVHRISCGIVPTATSGRPVCRYDTISSHSGYVKCANASVPLSRTPTDASVVNSNLNNGFYYE